MKGLQSTLMQYKSPKASNNGSAPQVQVIHCHGDHWIIGSTVHSGSLGNVQIYDSLFKTIDDQTVRRCGFMSFWISCNPRDDSHS